MAEESNRRQTLATDAAAIGQSGLAALGRVTIEEAVLPLAAHLRRLILAFHKLKNNAAAKATLPGQHGCNGTPRFYGSAEDTSEAGGVKRAID